LAGQSSVLDVVDMLAFITTTTNAMISMSGRVQADRVSGKFNFVTEPDRKVMRALRPASYFYERPTDRPTTPMAVMRLCNGRQVSFDPWSITIGKLESE